MLVRPELWTPDFVLPTWCEPLPRFNRWHAPGFFWPGCPCCAEDEPECLWSDWRYPTTLGDFPNDPGLHAWSNGSNAFSEDSTGATSTITASAPGVFTRTTQYLTVTGFGFSIPAGSLIHEIQIEIGGKASVGAQAYQHRLRISFTNGEVEPTAWQTQTGDRWSTSYATRYYSWNFGGTPATLAAYSFNSATWGVGLGVSIDPNDGPVTADVDFIRVRMFYCEEGATP